MVKGNDRFGKRGTEKCAVCRKMRRKVCNPFVFLANSQCEAVHPWAVCEYCKRHRVEHLCLKVTGFKAEPPRQLPMADDAKIPHEECLLLEYLFHELGFSRHASPTSRFSRFLRELGTLFRPAVTRSPLLRDSLLAVASFYLCRFVQLKSYLSNIRPFQSEVRDEGDLLAVYVLLSLFHACSKYLRLMYPFSRHLGGRPLHTIEGNRLINYVSSASSHLAIVLKNVDTSLTRHPQFADLDPILQYSIALL
jgi:hypothetical protein